MFSPFTTSLWLLITVLSVTLVDARVWTSKNGQYSLEAEAISFNDEMVVLKKPTGELVAIELSELSAEDGEYVRSKEVKDAAKKSAEEMQTWTAKDGMKVRARVLAYGRKELVIQRKLGKVHIDDKKFTTIDPLHQRLILKILSNLENIKLEDDKQLEEWGKTLGSTPKTYTLEGVLMQLESGDEIGVPFFLFSPEDLSILQPGWKHWLEQNESEESREKESFLVRSAAMAHQRDRAAQQQIEMLKLEMLAAETGIIAIWQVGLTPGPGIAGRPFSVMVPAQNSGIATNLAMQRYPGYVLGGVRRASR